MNNTTVEELKALYVKMGGNLTDTYEDIADGVPVADYVDIPDMIAALSSIAVPAELPSVTTDDNNKVLAVVDGNWDKAAAPAELPSVTAADTGMTLTAVNSAWRKTKFYHYYGAIESGVTEAPVKGSDFQSSISYLPYEIRATDPNHTNELLNFKLINLRTELAVDGNTRLGVVFKSVTVTDDGKLYTAVLKIPLTDKKMYVEYKTYTLTPEV